MIKVLFLIHDLSHGGAEKVLVNLVNNMDFNKFDITVMTLFDYGINKDYLDKRVHYKSWKKRVIRGNSHFMKILNPKQLYKMIVKDNYDIEISFLEGPCARVISGSTNKNAKKIAWIHTQFSDKKMAMQSFRSFSEAQICYNNFDKIVCVSESSKHSFENIYRLSIPVEVYYNTNDTEKILKLSKEFLEDCSSFKDEKFNIICLGKIIENKGFDRMIRVVSKLIQSGYNVQLYILGTGNQKESLEKLCEKLGVKKYISFLGYQTNPYKYLVRSDLYVCSSYREGFSTAATEALIVGTPVCTVNVSGMKEMLGNENEYGVIVDNDEESLFVGIKNLIDDKKKYLYYKNISALRGKDFTTEKTVSKIENMLFEIVGDRND